MRKVLARLEDAANPKTAEELKAERTQRDPTRVADAQTRAEREETISKLDAGEKLEDVRDLQDAVGRANDETAKGKTDDKKPADPASSALDTIQLLSAAVEATAIAEKAPAKTDATQFENKDAPAETTGEAVRNLDAAGIREQQERDEARKDIFALRIDDNGVYDLITRQLVA